MDKEMNKKVYVTPELSELGKFTKLTESGVTGENTDGLFPESIEAGFCS